MNKADEASPFALLVEAVAPQNPAKPPQKDASNAGGTQNNDGQAATDKSAADQAANDPSVANQSAVHQAGSAAAAPVTSPPSVKPSVGKPDKSKGEGDKTNGDGQIASAIAQAQNLPIPQQAELLSAPPPAAVQTAIPIVPVEGESDDTPVDMPAGPAAPAANLPAQADMKTVPKPAASGKTGGKPEVNAKSGADSLIKTDTNTKTDAAATAPAKAPEKPVAITQAGPGDENTDDDSKPQTAGAQIQTTSSTPGNGKTAASVQTPDTVTAQTAGTDPGQKGVAQNKDSKGADTLKRNSAASKNSAGKDSLATTDDTDKGAGIKIDAPKTRPVLASDENKGDAAKSNAPTSESLKPAAPQSDIQNIANTSKSAPQPAADAIAAVNSIAATQAQSSPVATAMANLHIQVSAHASPDLPALAVEIAAKSQSGAKQFDIRLDPPELGRVEVRLSIDASGKASAHLSADQPQTLSLLQKDAPILTRALRDAGLDVSQDGLNFSLRQQGENLNGSAGNNARRGSSRSLPLVATASIDATGGSAAYRGLANGRLDIRV
ncbi:MAG TPA: flagellar hook-length control protein FliK [Rhizomicrobium sp.]|nr:flagellar hook-length control protein FliK [Rhizomicrobium sp.]